jgi:flagella basal body P-ring formation protein FlgA
MKAVSNFEKIIITVSVILSGMCVCLPGRPGVMAGEHQAVTVRHESRVTGKDVLLGDISTIEGELQFIKKVENIVVGRAPFAGRERNFRRKQIIARMRQNNIDPKEVKIICPREVKVISDYEEFSRDEIEKITRGFILSHMPWEQESVKIKDFNCKPVLLPKGDVTCSFSIQKNEDYLGRFTTEISFEVDGAFRKKVRASAYITVIAPVAVCIRMVDRHKVIEPGDIKIEKRDITCISKHAVTDINEVVGKRAKCRIPPGKVLKRDMFENAPVVKRGDIVTIFVETDYFIITAPGEALEDGCRGDMIRVCNLTSNNKIYGFVKDSRQVEVKY